MNILIACEYSGRERDAFIAKGHRAISCDLLPTEVPGPHYEGDVRDILDLDWDMIIAHPDCTYLTNSGVRWLHTDTSRWPKLFEAADFFKMFLDHKCEKVCIENPIMHKYAVRLIGRKHNQMVQPWMFGEMESKGVCYWTKGLEKLKPTDNVKAEMDELPKSQTHKVHYASPGKGRWKERSRTHQSIANALADQWG